MITTSLFFFKYGLIQLKMTKCWASSHEESKMAAPMQKRAVFDIAFCKPGLRDKKFSAEPW